MSDTNRTADGGTGHGRATRRRYLAALGTLAATGTAGCGVLSGGGGGSGDEGSGGGTTTTSPLTTVSGPAQFARFTIEGPSEVTVGEAATFTVSAVNVGGERGDFQGSLVVSEGAPQASAEVAIEGVDPGTRGRTGVELTFKLADDVVLSLGKAEVQHELTVGPVTAGVGESLELGDLRATLTGTSVRSSAYRYRDGTVRGVFAPTDDRILVVVRFDAENAGTEATDFRLDRLELGEGSFLSSVGDAGLGALNDVEGRPITDATLEPAQERSGWLLAQVPREAATGGFEVRWQRDARGTPPERVWTVPGAEGVPDLRLVEWTLPETTRQGTTAYAATVENAGGADGTVRGLVRRGGPNADSLPIQEQFGATIGPGERRTFEFETTWLFSNERAFRLDPFGERRVVTFQPYRATFGETVPAPQDVSLTVDNPRFAEEITVDPYGTGPKSYTSENGRFLVVDAVADAPDGPANSPSAFEFSASVEGAGTYDKFGPRGRLIEPYQGKRPQDDELDLRDHVNPEGVEFVLVFDVDASADASNVTVRWDAEYTEGRSSIRWSQS